MEEQRWELRPASRWVIAALAVLAGAVWLPGAAFLLFVMGFLVAVPVAVDPVDSDTAFRWLAVPFLTVVGAYAAGWTAAGREAWRLLVRRWRSLVVVADGRGIRAERVTRRGRRVDLDLAWGDVRAARRGHGTVELDGTRGTTVLASVGDADEHERIVRHVNERLAAMPGRPPVVPGHTAYLDDRGATLVESRRNRRATAAWRAGLAVLCGLNAAALLGVAQAPSADGLEWFAAGVGAAGVGFAVTAVAFLRRTPRWIARPGAVVLERRLGRGFAFEARSLEIEREEGEGGVTYRLVAVQDPDGAKRSARKRMLAAAEDPSALRDVGTWLARYAEIPLRDVELTFDAP